MAHLSFGRDPFPVPAPLFQQRADLDVEFGAHGPIIAKFCAICKQHFAPALAQSSAMDRKTLNQVLALNLNRVMQEKP